MAKQTFTTGQVLTAAQMTSLQQTAMLGGAASAKTASYTLVAADAGTAISMSNAGATTITVNTGLFAAGDTVQITNLGVGVCTITAGTATVNTSASLALAQYESGTLDFTSSSAAIFIKGAGGAPASTSGLTYVGGTTFSASSAVNVNDVFSATYANYLVVLNNTASSDSMGRMRLRVSGSDNTTANYSSRSVKLSTVVESTTNYGDYWNLGVFFTPGAYSTVYVYNPQIATRTGYLFDTADMYNESNDVTRSLGGGIFKADTQFTGFTIYPGSGTITGTVRVYGLANS